MSFSWIPMKSKNDVKHYWNGVDVDAVDLYYVSHIT